MIIFDVNWDSVEDLYACDCDLPSRILFQAMTWQQARSRGWKNGEIIKISSQQNKDIYKVRFSFPPGWFISYGWLTMPLIARKVKKIYRELLGGKPEIGAFISPHYVPLQRALKPKVTIYHPIDDYTCYWPKRAELTLKREEQLIHSSDAIICASHYMSEVYKKRFPDRVKDIFHIPNPTPELFLAKEPTQSPIFQDAFSRKPRLGYIGAVDNRLCIKTIIHLSNTIPEAEIIIDTLQKPEPNPFQECSNVTFCKSLQRETIADVVKNFDICLLPQTKSHFNISCSPRKLYEYLGSSRPIVALNSHEAETLSPYVYTSKTTEEFVQKVKEILTKGEPEEFPRARWQLAYSCTPALLAKRYSAIINKIKRKLG